MLYLSGKKNSTRREMAAALGINEYYLPKIIKPLRDRKWIISVTGSIGGFELVEKPENITLLDIMDVMEGGIKLVDNLENEKFYSQKSTAGDSVYRILQNYQDVAQKYFSSVTLRDLLESQKQGAFTMDPLTISEPLGT
jgi:Rrf2 family protein